MTNFYHFGVIWRYLEPYVAIWSYLEPFGALCSYLYLFGKIWSHLEPFESIGAIWSHFESFGAIWPDLEQFGGVEQCGAICSYLALRGQKNRLGGGLGHYQIFKSYVSSFNSSVHPTLPGVFCETDSVFSPSRHLRVSIPQYTP